MPSNSVENSLTSVHVCFGFIYHENIRLFFADSSLPRLK